MMPLAQISLDTIPALVTFIVGGSAAVLLINQVLTFYKVHIREQPTPSQTYATKIELAKVEEKMAQVQGDLQESLDDLATDLKTEARSQAGKRKQIYEDIEQLGKDMATVKADQTNQTRQLYSMETKMDKVLERLPRP